MHQKAIRAGIRVEFVWQKGKTTAIGKQVDIAAKTAAKRGGIDVDTGYRPGSACRSKVKGGVAERFPAAGQTMIIRPYAKKVMHAGENRISFNIFDEALQTYPFVERLVGTLRREGLDRTLFWTTADLEAKLLDFQHYYDEHRTHAGRQGHPPVTGVNADRSLANLSCYRWQKHCRGLYQTPIAA